MSKRLKAVKKFGGCFYDYPQSEIKIPAVQIWRGKDGPLKIEISVTGPTGSRKTQAIAAAVEAIRGLNK